jgi:hypothetical protein
MLRSIIRWSAIVAVLAALVWIGAGHEHGRMKGGYVPLPNVASCVIVAAAAAFLCKRYWNMITTPFVGGVAGAFGIAEPFSGPFGGVMGLLVGLLIVLLPTGKRPVPTSSVPDET